MNQIFLTEKDIKLLKTFPIGSQDGLGDGAFVIVKFFSPRTKWRWYVLEADLDNDLLYGYVCGFEKEYGNFLVSTLRGMHDKYNDRLERDQYFKPCKLSKALEMDGYV